jgi:biopolymer transport protein ExbB
MRELWLQGGPVLGIILLASLAGAVVFLERLFHLHRAQIRTQDFLQGLYTVVRRKNVLEAVSLCEMTPGPVARITRAALLSAPDGEAAMREAVRSAGLQEIPRLERRLRVLGVIARLTPMLGLLGTILGLMEALWVMEQHAPLIHAGDLARPVWRALLCTAAGLGVSIPAYAGYHVLAGRVESLVLDMEQVAADVFSRRLSDLVAAAPAAPEGTP